jgi:hypothetical protein
VFTLTRFPLPPSSNHLYASVGGRLVKSIEGRKYDSYLQLYKLRKFKDLETISKAFQEADILHIETTFVFAKNKIVGKKGQIKKLDASNRIKQLHDGLSKLIGIDDCRFVSGAFSKATCERENEEQVIVKISRSELLTLDQVLQGLK